MKGRAQREAGFSVLEVIVSGTVLVVLLSLLASFLVQQQDLSVRTQARNEVQDKARVAMQIVAQDLQLSGARYYIDAAGDVTGQLGTCEPVSGQETCFAAVDGVNADRFGTVYITTTRSVLAEACRLVLYDLRGGDLLRVDQQTTCGTPLSADPDDHDELFAGNILASNIVAFNITYRCSNGRWIDSFPNAACPEGTTYPRSAVVSIYAASDNRYPQLAAESFDLVVADPDSNGASTTTRSVACPAETTCLGLTQEILLPNLKK